MDPFDLGPYRVLDRLGAGGMGEVYLAEDTRLGRRVAIKRPNDAAIARPDARERVRREARAAAQLNHPNVAAIYDVFDADGLPHIVMEYVEGTTLGALVRGGPLPSERVVTIGRQIAGALDAAHRRGIIHRDLKPGNVMLTAAGDVKVLDFGLAHVSVAAAGADGLIMTPASQVYGTPGYMAPEQFIGRPADERSDIFSCGALLFELLTGTPPFKGTDVIERAVGAYRGIRAPHAQAVNPAVPKALDDVVGRALAVNPADRFQNAADLEDALAHASDQLSEAPTVPVGSSARRRVKRSFFWPAATALTLATVTLALSVFHPRTTARGPATTTIVAVLPFSVAPGEPDLEALGAGLADMIVRALAATNQITVVPRTEALLYAAKKDDLARVAKDLGANHLVDGTLRRTAAGIEMTVRVVPGDRAPAWERAYPGTADEILTLGRRVLDDVVVELGASSAPPQTIGRSVEALQQYSQARSLMDRLDVTGNLDRAIQLLTASAAREDRAETHAALGEAYLEKYRATRDRQWSDRAQNEVVLALSMDPNQPLVRFSLANILSLTGQRDRSEQELRRLVAATPMDGAHRLLGQLLFERGRVDDAFAEFQRAIDLRPGYWRNYMALATGSMRAGRFPQAEQALIRVTELQPDQPGAYRELGTLHLLTGEFDRALSDFKRSFDMQPSATGWSNLGTTLYEMNRYDEALDAFRQAIALRPRDPVLQRNLGDILTRLQRTREARAAYEQGLLLAREALQVDPNATDMHAAIAICLAKLGRFDEAISESSVALGLAPGSAPPYQRHADVLALAGRSGEAMTALEEAVKHGLPPALIRIDHDLDSLKGLKRYQDLVPPVR